MVRFNKQTAFRVWKLLEDGDPIKSIADKLSVEPHIMEKRTVERLSSVLHGFNEKTNAELATKGWPENTIANLRLWWDDYDLWKHPHKRRLHVLGLCQLAGELRKRIINPDTPRRPFEGKSIWFWGNQDWRLAPSIWIWLVMPFLKARSLWSPLFPNLMSHLVDSSFLKNYRVLENKAVKLQEDLNNAMKEADKGDTAELEEWKRIQDELGKYATSNFVPDVIPTEENVAQLPYSMEYSERMIRLLSTEIPDLDQRFKDMENMLQQIWDDLEPDNIYSLIENGRCERCSSLGAVEMEL